MRDGKWVRQILSLQHEDGGWGYFHTLSQPSGKHPMTTEQALRRLRALGLTKDDEPISRALDYMRGILTGERHSPDNREKAINWDAFEAHMMAAWLRIFIPDDAAALPIARMWAAIITQSFAAGGFNAEGYAAEYRKRIPVLNKGERMISITSFYMVNLLKGMLDAETERRYVRHIISNPNGIGYVYDAAISSPPPVFASRQTSRYIAALEQLTGYTCACEELRFAVDWLKSHRDNNGEWDLGANANDGMYLPLSDSWRRPEDRRRDCTERISKLLIDIDRY